MQALHLRDARFRYKGSTGWAIDGVSLDVEKGEFVTILGPNDSGKSTICLMSNGLIPHALPGDLSGAVEVFGLDVRNHPVAELATKVGMVFQEPESQLFSMSVEEEVAFGPENLAIPREEIRERVEWALEIVGMKGYNDRTPFSLSGGQKQRVAIAAALSMHPEMLVLDEPAYALDPLGRAELYTVLRDLKTRLGVTILLAERDAEEASVFSDRTALMSEGKIIEVGTPKAMLRDPERLRSIGLEPPQLAAVASLLNAELGRSDLSFLSIDEAESAISKLLASRARRGSV
jgi:energy-coupling factor transport system ATP-binding protein